MPFPEIIGVLATIETKFGGDITQWLSQLLKGTNIASSDSTLRPIIGTDWRFKTGRLRFIDEAATPNEIQHTVAVQGGTRTIHIPALEVGVNEQVYKTLPQVLENKTIDINDGNEILNLTSDSIGGRLTKNQQEVNTVYIDQVNNFGNIEQKFRDNMLWISNLGNANWAKVGFLGTVTSEYDIPPVDANSYILAVSKTSITAGDIFYWDGTKLIRLGIGDNGRVLKVVSGVPSWQEELNTAGLPSRGYFATDYASASTLGANRYQSVSGDSSVSTTLAQRQIPITNDINITAVKVNMVANSMNQITRAGILDDGVLVASVSIPAGATGPQTAVISGVTIVAGSQIALVYDTMTASSGTYEIRPLLIEYTIGAPGAFGDEKVIVKEIGVQVGSQARPINFNVGTDFLIADNAGANTIDIRIANDAIKTDLILNGNVTLDKLATDSVDASKIATGAVGTNELAGSIPDSKLAQITDKAKLPSDVVYSTGGGFMSRPSTAKEGTLIPSSNTALNNFNGLLRGAAVSATSSTINFDATHGGSLGLGSSGAIANYVGWELTPLIFTRGHNLYLKAKFKLSRNDIRQFFGFVNSGSTMAGDDPLNARSGIIVGKITTNGNWRIAVNDGSGATTFVDTGVAVETSIPHTIEIVAVAASNKFQWSFDGSPLADITTNIPAAGTPMRLESYVDPRSANIVNFDEYYVEAKNDK